MVLGFGSPTQQHDHSFMPNTQTNTDFIPSGTKHPVTAHLFLNYLYRTDVNVLLIKTIGYPPAHKHVMEFMSPEMKAWPGFILPDGYL